MTRRWIENVSKLLLQYSSTPSHQNNDSIACNKSVISGYISKSSDLDSELLQNIHILQHLNHDKSVPTDPILPSSQYVLQFATEKNVMSSQMTSKSVSIESLISSGTASCRDTNSSPTTTSGSNNDLHEQTLGNSASKSISVENEFSCDYYVSSVSQGSADLNFSASTNNLDATHDLVYTDLDNNLFSQFLYVEFLSQSQDESVQLPSSFKHPNSNKYSEEIVKDLLWYYESISHLDLENSVEWGNDCTNVIDRNDIRVPIKDNVSASKSSVDTVPTVVEDPMCKHSVFPSCDTVYIESKKIMNDKEHLSNVCYNTSNIVVQHSRSSDVDIDQSGSMSTLPTQDLHVVPSDVSHL